MKRNLNRSLTYVCRCDERLKTKTEGTIHLTYTGLCGGLEHLKNFILYYESIKREVKRRPINECRCDERLKTKTEESTHLTCTGLLGELKNGKIIVVYYKSKVRAKESI